MSYNNISWRDNIMTKAEFNAMAAERRANRAGSGFDEFGKHYSTASVNEGFYPENLSALYMGRRLIDGVGTSRTQDPYCSVNGVLLHLLGINSADTTVRSASLILPPTPTVLPSTATLTQQQIDSGVIKHADASNSGLILNGKFDTDTSGWTAYATDTIATAASGEMKLTSTVGYARNGQVFNTVIGKKYIIEFECYRGTSASVYLYVGTIINNNSLGSLTLTNTTKQRFTLEFTATSSTTALTVRLNETDAGTTGYFDNIAVFPADAISRSDLVFLESWHEDVSEKDFIYPLGNVQYLGTTGDAGTTVAGAFAGSTTYSLFSDTWQADSALVGKGYVWSTLSDANKKAFVANSENNCYLDGDKVIQVRYRMRVVQGLADSWANVDPQINSYFLGVPAVTGSNSFIKPKGSKASSVDLGVADGNGLFGSSGSVTTWTNLLPWCGVGHFVAADIYGDTNGFTTGSYNGQCFALPIALVHRRNTGMMHPVYNPNGTKLASDSLPWYSTTVSFTSIADCFTESKLLATSGYIGTATGRSDGLFYDQIHEGDITDLRMSAKVPTDYNRLIDREFNRLVAGTYRGTEGELKIELMATSTAITSLGNSVAYLTGFPTITSSTHSDVIAFIGFNTRSKSVQNIFIYNGSFIDSSWGVNISHNSRYVTIRQPPSANPNGAWIVGDVIELYAVTKSTRTKSNTLTHTDIIGSPANYPASWKQSGVSGTPLIVAEDGTSLLPTGTTGSDGLATFKLSHKANATPLQVLKSTDSGTTWTALTVTTHYTFSTTTNAITFTAGNIPLTTDLIRVTYQTHTNMAIPTVNSEVLAIGDTYGTTYNAPIYGAILNSSLLGKIAVGASTNRYNVFTGLREYQCTSSRLLYSGHGVPVSHNNLDMAKEITPAVKTFPYLTRSNGKAYLNLVFKEMKYDSGKDSASELTTITSSNVTTDGIVNGLYYVDQTVTGILSGKLLKCLVAFTTDFNSIGWVELSSGKFGVPSSSTVYLEELQGLGWGDDSKFNIVDNVSTTTDNNAQVVLIGQKRVELPYFIGAAE